MASMEALAKSYKIKKIEIAKLRRRGENALKEATLRKRRSSSGLVWLARKNEFLGRQIGHVAQLLNQHLAQKESISRLKIAAEERLRHEQDAQDSARQQSEYGGLEEKVSAQEKLKFIGEKIVELHSQLKERELAEARLVKQIGDLQKEKAKLDLQLKKQAHIKPGLLEQLKSSEKTELALRPRVQSLIKREEQTTKILQSMEKRLKEIISRRRKTRAKTRTKKAKKVARKKVKKAKRKITKRKAKARRSKSKRR